MATDESEPQSPPRLPRGAYSKIARRMRPKVTPQHVREVHLGQATSARVTAAIARFVASLEETRASASISGSGQRLAS